MRRVEEKLRERGYPAKKMLRIGDKIGMQMFTFPSSNATDNKEQIFTE